MRMWLCVYVCVCAWLCALVQPCTHAFVGACVAWPCLQAVFPVNTRRSPCLQLANWSHVVTGEAGKPITGSLLKIIPRGPECNLVSCKISLLGPVVDPLVRSAQSINSFSTRKPEEDLKSQQMKIIKTPTGNPKTRTLLNVLDTGDGGTQFYI